MIWGDQEDGVVAKATGAAGDVGRGADAAFAGAADVSEDGAVGCGDDHDAYEAGGALDWGDGVEFAEDALEIVGVALVAGKTGFDAIGGVVTADDAGAAVQGIDF